MKSASCPPRTSGGVEMPAQGPAASAPLGLQGQHTVGETDPWKINVADHADRKTSRDFAAAKRLADKILATLGLDGAVLRHLRDPDASRRLAMALRQRGLVYGPEPS